MFQLFKYTTGNAHTAYHVLHFTVNINGHTSYHDGKYYETCPDCLLSEDTTLLPDGKSKGRYLFLYSEALCLYSVISSHIFCSGCISFSPTITISVACSFKPALACWSHPTLRHSRSRRSVWNSLRTTTL